MSFSQELIITIIDKGVLAVVIAGVGYYIKLWLQQDQSRRDLVREISQKRADAYAGFWQATENFRRTDPVEFTQDLLESARKEMTRVYFDQGGAMYLSFSAASKFLAAKNLLAQRIDRKASPSDDDLRQTFSAFRTQLKVDLLIYTEKEAQTPLQT